MTFTKPDVLQLGLKQIASLEPAKYQAGCVGHWCIPLRFEGDSPGGMVDAKLREKSCGPTYSCATRNRRSTLLGRPGRTVGSSGTRDPLGMRKCSRVSKNSKKRCRMLCGSDISFLRSGWKLRKQLVTSCSIHPFVPSFVWKQTLLVREFDENISHQT